VWTSTPIFSFGLVLVLRGGAEAECTECQRLVLEPAHGNGGQLEVVQMTRDSGRQAVYRAEHQVWKAVERAVAGGTVDFFGSQLRLPEERKFASIAEIQGFVDEVMAAAEVQGQWPGVKSPTVRHRVGRTQAHYEPASAAIAIPSDVTWAMRELVVLHECAHHIMTYTYIYGANRGSNEQRVASHGLEFVAVYVQLVSWILGDEVALLLRAAFDGQNIVVRPLSEVSV